MSNKKKLLNQEYLEEVLNRIAQGEKPKKEKHTLSEKAFLEQVMPHIQLFLEEGYTVKEIARFLGAVTMGDIKKALKEEEHSPYDNNAKESKPVKTAAAPVKKSPPQPAKSKSRRATSK